MVNTLIYGNQARWTGGGIDIAASEIGDNNMATATLVDCTITDSVSDSDTVSAEKGGGSQIHAYQGIRATASLTMYNTIAHGNRLGSGDGQDLSVEQRAPGRAEVSAQHSDIGDMDGDPNLYTTASAISADPVFFDPEDDDYHLLVAALCRDGGTVTVSSPPGLPDSDCEGDSSSIGAAPDIGADDLRPGVQRSVYLPLLLRYPGQQLSAVTGPDGRPAGHQSPPPFRGR